MHDAMKSPDWEQTQQIMNDGDDTVQTSSKKPWLKGTATELSDMEQQTAQTTANQEDELAALPDNYISTETVEKIRLDENRLNVVAHCKSIKDAVAVNEGFLKEICKKIAENPLACFKKLVANQLQAYYAKVAPLPAPNELRVDIPVPLNSAMALYLSRNIGAIPLPELFDDEETFAPLVLDGASGIGKTQQAFALLRAEAKTGVLEPPQR